LLHLFLGLLPTTQVAVVVQELVTVQVVMGVVQTVIGIIMDCLQLLVLAVAVVAVVMDIQAATVAQV
jgi:hypothetical protein